VFLIVVLYWIIINIFEHMHYLFILHVWTISFVGFELDYVALAMLCIQSLWIRIISLCYTKHTKTQVFERQKLSRMCLHELMCVVVKAQRCETNGWSHHLDANAACQQLESWRFKT